ncbi:MAG: poly-gamma-glutamate biosynthesis protein [uncultured bacterium]|nr:MAG: poly-gamma-glutamate biosynthesis protein [uncultured bacterium]
MRARVFFSGDVVNTNSHNTFISEEIISIINNQDFSVCNFEAPIEGFGEKILKAGPHISQKPDTIKQLKDAGFNLLLLANNHMYDYGETALATTINEITNQGLNCIGAGLDYNSAYRAFLKEINGIKIAFLNASEAQFGVLDEAVNNRQSGYAWINHYLFDELVISSKKIADIVIICAHAGLEDYSIPMDDWRRRYKRLCDLGADCIIGSHPHLPQGYEIYKNKPIFYSLGNFFFDTLSFKNLPDYSYSVILDISKTKITFDFVYHHKEKDKVQLTNPAEIPFSIIALNEELVDKNLQKQMYLDSYNKITKPFFAGVHNSIIASDTFIIIIKKIILKIFPFHNIKRRQELLLLHLIRNETYRWITIKAIQLKQDNKT